MSVCPSAVVHPLVAGAMPPGLWSAISREPLPSIMWFQLAAVFVIALYINFRQVFTLRNWDIIALLAMVPGLILVPMLPSAGFIVLLVVTGYWIGRCLVDVVLPSRPAVACNLNAGGLAFLLVGLFAFQIAVVFDREPHPTSLAVADGARSLLRDKRMPYTSADGRPTLGPGAYWLYVPAVAVSEPAPRADDQPGPATQPDTAHLAARIGLVVAHVLLVIGLVLAGWKRLGGVGAGLALAVLCLLLPYARDVADAALDVWPAVAVVWAVVLCTWPPAAAAVLALGASIALVPLFLVPLWCSYYKGGGRWAFLLAFLVVYVGLTATAWIGGGGTDVLWTATFGVLEGPGPAAWDLTTVHSADSFWSHVATPTLRIPLLILYLAVCGALALWPARKTQAALIALSAVVVLGSQFWIGHAGGTYVLWYLPLLGMVGLRGPSTGQPRR